jgi:hypothetical protein
MTNTKQPFLPKIFGTGSFKLQPAVLSTQQLIIFISVLVIITIAKVLIIPYNMVDHGEGATRTRNALWWAWHPFFVEPASGNPGWFYLVGPLLMLTKEIFYTPIILMILAVTLAAVYIFKITLLFGSFRTAMLAFFIFTLNPVIFRLNFTPVPQQLYLAAMCIMIYYFIKALSFEDEKLSIKYFIFSGMFSFIGLTFRPEGLFTLLVFCLLALITRKRGSYYYIILTVLFQLIWMAVSYKMYGSLFRTFEGVREYDYLTGTDIAGSGIIVKLRGFFLPYYFMVVGTTFILFYFFIKGTLILYKKQSLIIFLCLIIPVFIPALINGLLETVSSQYDTTRYFYLTFYSIPVITAIGLEQFLQRFKISAFGYAAASIIILSAIPLSYIKDFLPAKYSKLYPKVIQFIATSEDPMDAWSMIKFIDENINAYPALIFDIEGSDSSILYVPFRTKIAPPEKIMISGYNIPTEKIGLTEEIKRFIKKNPRGIIMFKKDATLMNQIFTELTAPKQYVRHDMQKAGETDNWIIYTYEPINGAN